MANRRDPFTFDALDPEGGTYKVYVQEKRLRTLARLGPSHLLDARDLVPEVLEHPTVIFEGLRWEGDEDKDRPGWRCYCGKPSFMYDKRGDKVDSDPNQVFLVFVNHERIAYNWRWEFADEKDAAIPTGVNAEPEKKGRFISKVFDQREEA